MPPFLVASSVGLWTPCSQLPSPQFSIVNDSLSPSCLSLLPSVGLHSFFRSCDFSSTPCIHSQDLLCNNNFWNPEGFYLLVVLEVIDLLSLLFKVFEWHIFVHIYGTQDDVWINICEVMISSEQLVHPFLLSFLDGKYIQIPLAVLRCLPCETENSRTCSSCLTMESYTY